MQHHRYAKLGGSGSWVAGWKLDPDQRALLLERFPPKHAFTVADHVTLHAKVRKSAPPPPNCHAVAIGHVDDGTGVEALIVELGGTTDRPDGSTYHITWSLGPGRKAIESNDVISRLGWHEIEPIGLDLKPAIFR